MCEVVRGKSLLLVHVERIDVLERWLLEVLRYVCLVVLEGSGLLSRRQGPVRSR